MCTRKRIKLLSLIIFIFSIFILPEAAVSERITFASHTVGTSNHAITTALCKVASEHSGILVVVSPTSGASSWVPLMQKSGKPEIGMAHILDAWWAFTGKISPIPLPGNPLGTKPFYDASPNLRVLVAGPRMWVGMIAKANAPFKTVREAAGKRIAGGFAAHVGAYAPLVACLHNVGLREADFDVVVVPGAEAGVRALMEGRVDLCSASIGMPVVSEANTTIGVRFLITSMDSKGIKAVKEVFPGATVQVRSPGPAGINEPTPLLNYPLMTVTSTHLPDEVAYKLVKTWWDYHKETWPIHPACKGWEPKDFVIKDVTVPYHSGAIKFYKEKGVWDAEMDTIQARLLKGEYPFLD